MTVTSRSIWFSVLAVIGIHGACDSGKGARRVEHPMRAAQVAEPAAQPVQASAAPHSKDEWVREIVDPLVLDDALGLSIVDGTVQLIASPVTDPRDVVAFDRVNDGWAASLISDDATLHASARDQGEPWILQVRKTTAESSFVGRGKRQLEGVLLGEGVHSGDLGLDRHGQPHVCFATNHPDRAKELVYAHRTAQGHWAIERLPITADTCSVIPSDDMVHVIARGPGGVTVFSKTKDGWTRELVTSLPWGVSVVGARAPSGEVSLVVHQDGRFALLRRRAGGWARNPMAIESGSQFLSGLAVAIDQRGTVHVAFSVRDGGKRLMYAKDGSPPSLVAPHGPDRIVLAVDAAGAAHLAYTGNSVHQNQLVYARQRSASDTPTARNAYHVDTRVLLESCAELVLQSLGQQPHPDRLVRTRATRWCGHLVRNPALPPLTELEERCRGGSSAACVVGGAVASADQALARVDLLHRKCADRDPEMRCWNATRTKSQYGTFNTRGDDTALAIQLFARACSLGEMAACAHGATLEAAGRAPDAVALARACGPRLPIACAAALEAGPRHLTPSVLRTMREALEVSCAKVAMPEACNALAFMKEAGLGGPVRLRDAGRHHERACLVGSTASCTRLVVGPMARPRPPRGLDVDAMLASLLGACTDVQNEDACLAIATALNAGWGTPRDRPRARELLEDACARRMPGACKQIGKRVPPPDAD